MNRKFSSGTDAPVLELQQLQFCWPRSPVPCLDLAELRVAPGDTLFVHGPSGCGKTTLLSLMAGVLIAQRGSATLAGHDWRQLPAAARDRHRVDHVGYIFQQFNLLSYLSVLDNVLLPCRFSARRRAAAERRSGSAAADAQAWLTDMGLERGSWSRAASDLSVGQQQRVAAARALIGTPPLVIADEPTSALDEDRRDRFVALLLDACAAARSALVFVSHDRRLAARFARELLLPSINRARAPQEPAA